MHRACTKRRGQKQSTHRANSLRLQNQANVHSIRPAAQQLVFLTEARKDPCRQPCRQAARAPPRQGSRSSVIRHRGLYTDACVPQYRRRVFPKRRIFLLQLRDRSGRTAENRPPMGWFQRVRWALPWIQVDAVYSLLAMTRLALSSTRRWSAFHKGRRQRSTVGNNSAPCASTTSGRTPAR